MLLQKILLHFAARIYPSSCQVWKHPDSTSSPIIAGPHSRVNAVKRHVENLAWPTRFPICLIISRDPLLQKLSSMGQPPPISTAGPPAAAAAATSPAKVRIMCNDHSQFYSAYSILQVRSACFLQEPPLAFKDQHAKISISTHQMIIM